MSKAAERSGANERGKEFGEDTCLDGRLKAAVRYTTTSIFQLMYILGDRRMAKGR
jgi:hypothetical protein